MNGLDSLGIGSLKTDRIINSAGQLKLYGNVELDKKVDSKGNESDGKLSLAGEVKAQYLKLAVGEKEKELEKLGFTRDEDGKVYRKPGYSEEEENSGECETCANRKYQDGSDEMVSFKSASHIGPEAAATAVRAHEGEHVSNAYDKAEQGDGKVVNASVSIHTSVCPECGRVYVSGGTTNTTIRYNSDKYASNTKKLDEGVLVGKGVDTKA